MIKLLMLLIIIIIIIIIIGIIYKIKINKRNKKTIEKIKIACKKLNILKDLNNTKILCPINWTNQSVNNLSIISDTHLGDCKQIDNNTWHCNRCFIDDYILPQPYPNIPIINVKNSWPNMSSKDFGNYNGPTIDGSAQIEYETGYSITDPAPVPDLCLKYM